MSENELFLVGNDSQHVVFTETKTGSGKAIVSGLKGGVHLLKYFLENLQSERQNLDPNRTLQIQLQHPHWSIELSKKKRKKQGKNDEIEEFFAVERHLHIRDPSLMKIETKLPSDKRIGVLLLEDPVQERELSAREVLDIYSLVNDAQVDDLLVCKISRPLSKIHWNNLITVLETKVETIEPLKTKPMEFLLLQDASVDLFSDLSIRNRITVMDALKKFIPSSVTDNAKGSWFKQLQNCSINEFQNDMELGKYTAPDKKDLFETLLKVLGPKTGKEGTTLLHKVLSDIEVLAHLTKITDKSILSGLVKNYETLKTRPVIIVDAEDLRKEGAQLSYHLSWSKTVEEFTQFLSSDNTFATDLKKFPEKAKAPHLIVRFGCDGIIHYDSTKDTELGLYYANATFVEGDYVQHKGTQMIGEATAFTAGLVSKLAGDSGSNMKDAILHGMKAACLLASKGFQACSSGFMYPDISEGAPPKFSDHEPLTIDIGDRSKFETGRWSILTNGYNSLEVSRKAMLDLAKSIVRIGTGKALKDKPTAQFGNLVTVDREEMENFRGIANLVQDYMKTPQTKPLSIGVFGFPGSGKSFGVGEVIKAVASGQGKEIHKLEFNLSQFLEYSDLLAAFQSIRDQTFSNKVPVVMFDEFDCSFGGKALGWLQYFLAPMQDGKFLERGHLRPLGSAIFIFVGGTSPTFAEFQATARERAAVAAKKPDFVSRLRGSVDIWGPNKLSSRDDGDETYTVRRAIILRSLLERNKRVGGSDFNVADKVLDALLCVSGFHHGTRSLEAIVKMSRITPTEEFTAAGLPSNDRLSLYVDPIEFGEWLKGWRDNNKKKRDAITKAIWDINYVQAARNWEPSEEETKLLSKAVAENISIFLDGTKATDLTQWETAEPTNNPEDEKSEQNKIQQIAKGAYDQLKAIRSNRRTAVEMMPWWFVEKQNEPKNRYFVIADTVWITLRTRQA